MNVDAYLERISYRGSLTPTAETLRELQLAHLRTVPFENLSIHAQEPIVLEDEALFTKIVDNKRGGFCYECNGLFATLLRALGFKVAMLAAEVANPAGEFGPPYDHMTLLVSLEDLWLVDVGFGDSFLEPLRLAERDEQAQGNRAYRIDSEGARFVLLQREEAGDLKPQYQFTLEAHEYADYAEMCRYHQTSPDSHFTRSRICSRATEQGRLTLSDLRFITRSQQGAQQTRQERILADEAEYRAILREQFGIEMNEPMPLVFAS